MVDYSWGGYQNGQIPSIAMAIIPGTADFIKKELLPGVVALRDAFRAEFGYTLSITEAYRSLVTQQSLYNGWVARKPGFNLAAYPGTSMHGWGLSIDFGSNVNTYGSAEKQWMDENAPRYGFEPTGNSFYPREAWHFDGTGTMAAGGNATPIDTEAANIQRIITTYDSEENMPHLYVQDQTAGVSSFAWIVAVGGGLGTPQQFTPANGRADWIAFKNLYNAAAGKQNMPQITDTLLVSINDEQYQRVIKSYS